MEDNEHRLIGIISHISIVRLVAERTAELGKGPIAVREVMSTEIVSVTPETSTLDAIALMRKHAIGCLPVLKDGRLVGIVTEHDFLIIAGQLLENELRA